MMRFMAPALPALPPRAVLDAFGAAGDPDRGLTPVGAQPAPAEALRPLPGGQGSSVLAGPLVLKPHAAEHLAEARWSAEVVERMAGRAVGFRVARPVRARDGALFVEGWGATEFLEGELRGVGPADWPALFEAGRAYNEALCDLPRPEMLDLRTHRWALADRVAFGAAYPDPVPAARLLLETLLRQRRPSREPAQIIHGDLAGNVLFSPGRPPAVIDFSPYWRPADYALAVAAVDALLWYEAPVSVLELVAGRTGPEFADHLIRALIFRLVAHSEAVKAAGGTAASAAADPEMERFDLVYDLVKRFQRGPLGSAGSRAFDAVLCDVDGVLRHWPSDDALESAHGLAPGAFAAVAFAPGRLLPAVTGAVTDERWRESVAEGLVEEGHCATPADARAVVARWNGVRPRVDEDVLALLQLAREVLPVVLVSNATSRLEADLKELGLAEFVDQVVNTSRIGFAKPDPRVFAHAARQAGVPVERCLFVDDTGENVEAARAAGMHAVHFHEAADLEEALRPIFLLLRRPA
jgi:putative hydrolase of the HAD superfamily